jgi:hypothetical protein
MMNSKYCAFALAVLLLSGGIFAQEKQHRHESFDMLLGINAGLGVGWSNGFLDALTGDGAKDMKAGNINAAVSAGINYDFYLFPWLSFSTGFSLRPMIALMLTRDATSFDISDLSNQGDSVIVRTPVSLTFPVQVHVNIPYAEWLYAGFGMNINIPVPLEGIRFDSSFFGIDNSGGRAKLGRTFFSIPVDFGFDFIKPGRGGGRLFFRYELSFLENDVMVNTYGFVWQIYNFKLNHRK